MPLRATHAKLALSALRLAVLTGCASVGPDQNINRVNERPGFHPGASSRLYSGGTRPASAGRPKRWRSLWVRKKPSSWPW